MNLISLANQRSTPLNQRQHHGYHGGQIICGEFVKMNAYKKTDYMIHRMNVALSKRHVCIKINRIHENRNAFDLHLIVPENKKISSFNLGGPVKNMKRSYY